MKSVAVSLFAAAAAFVSLAEFSVYYRPIMTKFEPEPFEARPLTPYPRILPPDPTRPRMMPRPSTP